MRTSGTGSAPAARGRTFRVVLVKPSHYDRDGYVIQWWRSTIPSNSLASVHGLLLECAQDKVLGTEVDIEIDAYDECNTIIDVAGIARRILEAGGGFVALVGVQSNQFPRALDLGRRFRAAGIPVVVGGFHVSGCLSMLPELPADLRAARDLGISLFAGEAEGRMAQLLRDIDAGELKPVYNFLSDLPDMDAAALPILPRRVVTRVAGHYASFDAGRGCPFQCSFCTIINVQGRKSRYRTPDDVEAIVRANAAQDVTRFFVTDDNFARNKNWEPILDRLIELREKEGFKIRLLLQVDTLCHRIPGFIEKAARAGCNAVFIGLENINPQSLMGTKKRQNKIWEYRDMLQAWRRAKVMTWAGYILGFPTDTPETIARDIEIIKRELPIDILEFFFLTPLPGSEDHKNLHLRGVVMDPDMNKYDLEHACTAHPLMPKEVWEEVYRNAWTRYYTDAHVETVLRRAVASGLNPRKIVDALTIFSGATRIEGVHPLQFGFVRRKARAQRRHGMALETPLVFYARRMVESAVTALRWLRLARRYRGIMKRVLGEATAAAYLDEALREPSREAPAMPDFVEVFADKIPKTHGAPVRQAALS
ncbi:MAG: radical SAM protein [Methylobacteriaceae bacterium]|nr:radical SAM protein [Methylobacteriaceae bacterium]